jgi:HSP90 family molecular chaperone
MEQQAQAQEATIPRIAEEAEASSRSEEAPRTAQREVEHPEFEAMIQRVQRGLDAKVEQVRQDRRLDKGEQRQQITDIWNRVSEFHATTFKAHEGILEDRAGEQEG